MADKKCDICKNVEVTRLRKVIFMYHHAHANVCKECDKKTNSELEHEWQSSFVTNPVYFWTIVGIFGGLACLAAIACLCQKLFV